MRHGKTDWNEQYKLQGRTDIPLNDVGRQMARDAAEKYKDIHFDVCYCSPLTRARETAALVLEGRDIPIIADDRLVEMSFGSCEGEARIYSKPDSPVHTLFMHPESYIPPEGAESLHDLYERTGNFLREVAEPLLAQGKDILIVGHGAMDSAIVCQIKNIPLKDFWSVGIENCKLMQLL